MRTAKNSAVTRYSVATAASVAIWMSGGAFAWAKSNDAGGSGASGSAADAAEPGNWAEKKAGKLAGEAIGSDYWSGRYAAAEKKLREGIQICMVQKCSNAFQARLHRDLGVVYIAGMKHVEEGKDEFTAALTADSGVTLAPSMDMPTVKQAFDEVKASISGSQSASASKDTPAKDTAAAADASSKRDEEAKEEPKATEEKKESKAAEEEQEPASSEIQPPPAAPEPVKRKYNWFSLGFQQDFVFHSKTADACASGSQYSCYAANNVREIANPGSYVPGGNQVGAAGFQPGTLRILVGYDRVLGQRFTVGARLGSVLTGKAPIFTGERAFMYFHGEARAAAWLGPDPFGTSKLRPYVFLAGGVAETDSKVSVQVEPNNPPNLYTFHAWKRSGDGFVGGGLGILAVFSEWGGPLAELKYVQYLGTSSLPTVAVQLGYSLGL